MAESGPQYIPREHVASFERYQRLVRLFEQAFRIPGTNWRFGIDALLGLIPGLGDLAGALAAGYGVWLARRMGAPAALQVRMLGNVALDALGGAVPLLGDLFDFAFKAQLRNRALLEGWLAAPQRVARSSQLVVLAAVVAVTGVLVASVGLAAWTLRALLGLVSGA